MSVPSKIPGWRYAEIEALDLAKEWLRQCMQGDFLELGVPPFWSGRPLLRRMLMMYAMAHTFNLDHVVAMAVEDGSPDAAEALEELITEHNARYEPLPASLASYSIRTRNPGLRPPAKRRGRRKADKLGEDLVVVTVMMKLVEDYLLLPTRNRFGNRDGRHSAASIMALAMKELGLHRGGEDGLRKIWNRYAPRILPGTVAEALIPVLQEERKTSMG